MPSVRGTTGALQVSLAAQPRGTEPRSAAQGFTLIELMIAIAVVGVVALISAPSFRDLILKQRLRGVHAQAVTDLQFARSQAAELRERVWVGFRSDATSSCYTVYAAQDQNSALCNCLNGAGAACGAGARELKSVTLPRSLGPFIASATPNQSGLGFDPVTGQMLALSATSSVLTSFHIDTSIDAPRRLRVVVGLSGRPTVCSPPSTVMGAPPC